MPVMPFSAQSCAARPLTKISGLPRGLGITSTSRQRMPPLTQTHPQRLGEGLLGREAHGEARRGPGLAPAVGDFALGEDAGAKAVAVAPQDPLDPGHLHQVHADTVDHERFPVFGFWFLGHKKLATRNQGLARQVSSLAKRRAILRVACITTILPSCGLLINSPSQAGGLGTRQGRGNHDGRMEDCQGVIPRPLIPGDLDSG